MWLGDFCQDYFDFFLLRMKDQLMAIKLKIRIRISSENCHWIIRFCLQRSKELSKLNNLKKNSFFVTENKGLKLSMIDTNYHKIWRKMEKSLNFWCFTLTSEWFSKFWICSSMILFKIGVISSSVKQLEIFNKKKTNTEWLDTLEGEKMFLGKCDFL